MADEKKLEEDSKKESASALEEELEKCKKEKEEYLSGWKRAKADFINYKKDEADRLEKIVKHSNEGIIKELVNVLDSFDLGLSAMEKNGQVEKGVYMIKSQLEDVLKRFGLSKISIKTGDKFNPSVAEAVSVVESEMPSGTIVEEIECGYRLYDKVIRPARVKVAK